MTTTRKSPLQTLLFVLLLSFAFDVHAQVIPNAKTKAKKAARAPAQAPFVSDDEVEYLQKSPQNFLGFNRSAEFDGAMTRPFAAKKDLSQIYVYKLGAKAGELTRPTCEDFVQKIIGQFGEISLKKSRSEIFQARYGQACHVVMLDPDSVTFTRERHILVAVIGTEIYALMFQFRTLATKAELIEMENFVKSLKSLNDAT